MQSLNRQKSEELVIDLYYNQKKTFREIQKIVRKSPRDIKAILDKVEPERSSSFSASSRAYQMFKEGSTLTDVAITLNLRQKEVSEYYKEFWDLNGLHNLNQIHQETKGDIWFLIQLYRSIKSAGLSIPHVINLLKITNNNIPSIEGRITEPERNEASLNFRNQQAAKTFQKFNDDILKEKKTLDQYSSDTKHLKEEIAHLNMKKTRLENFVGSFQINNGTCVRIKEIVRQEIEKTISQPRRLIRIVIASIFESERKNPGKLRALYYNTSPTLSVEQLLLQCLISQNEQHPNQFGYNEDSLERLLLDEAEQSYNRFAEVLTGKCMNDITNDTESLTLMSQLPARQPTPSTSTIPDTSEGEISIRPAIMNNFALEICRHNSNIANEPSSGTDVQLRKKDESDTCNFLQD